MSEFKKLILDRGDAITAITLNRPECHNALDRELSDELNDAVRRVRDDRDCRIMILGGAGETFCAGDDIKDFMTWKSDDVLRGHDAYWQIRLYQETAQILDGKVGVNLIKEKDIADVNFRVTADSFATVYLLGRARSQGELDLALAAARGTEGVKKVVNYVEVRP